MEKHVREALDVIEADYRGDVDGICKDVIDEIKAKNIEDRGALIEYIEESIDGCSRVIYTQEAQAGLLASHNDSAAIDEGMVDPSRWKSGVDWSQLMYWALRQDVIEHLDRLGVDVDSEWPFGLELEEKEEEPEEEPEIGA